MTSIGRGRGVLTSLENGPGPLGRGRGTFSAAPSTAMSFGGSHNGDSEDLSQSLSQMNLEKKSSGSDRAPSVCSSSAVALSNFVTRPKHITTKMGTKGEEIVCCSNFIPIESFPDWHMYQYCVKIDPVIDSKIFRIQIIKDPSLVEYFGEEPVFDGSIFYSPCRLPQDSFELKGVHPKSGDVVAISVKLTNEISIDDQQCLTIFNLCNRKAFESLGYTQMGRHYFDPKKGAVIQRYNLEIWPGVVASIRMYEEQLLMCCETSHKVLRLDTVYNELTRIYKGCQADRFRNEAIRELVGTSVMTKYNNKTYRIDDILWEKHPTDELVLADGTRMTYKDYYRIHYDINVKDDAQPMLVSRSKKHGGLGSLASQPDIHLIPELCTMTGLTDKLRADRKVMQELAQYTRVSPAIRAQNARKYLADINSKPEVKAIFKNWNLTMGADIVHLKGRVLPLEPVFFKERRVEFDRRQSDWSRECRANALNDAVPLDHWVMVFHPDQSGAAQTLFREIQQQAGRMKWPVREPTIIRTNGNGTDSYLEAIARGIATDKAARIVVVVVDSSDSSRYVAIKKQCCIGDHPIPSQVVRAEALQKNTPSVCSKIMLQMNCKMGGSVWRVGMPLSNSMVIGYDCYHDSTNKTMTVGAAVSSIDPNMTRWYSSSALHKDPKQMAQNIVSFVRKALEKYHATNNKFPDNVFLYRDGVGEGQIPVVFGQELPLVRRAMEDAGATSTKLAFIIVTKKVTLRFFQEKAGGQFDNPPPGSLIDSCLTRRERYDFYLVPQAVRQGTVTPVSYNVIHDDTGLAPDQMQRLAYKLCHLYYNWQGTIRVPAPCQYAHKLATLVAQSVHTPAADSLADKLYYL